MIFLNKCLVTHKTDTEGTSAESEQPTRQLVSAGGKSTSHILYDRGTGCREQLPYKENRCSHTIVLWPADKKGAVKNKLSSPGRLV